MTIIVKSSRLISLSISALNMFYMLFNLLKKQLFCVSFLFFLIVFKSFLEITLLIENNKLRLAFANLTDTPITVANEAIKTPPRVADKRSKILLK